MTRLRDSKGRFKRADPFIEDQVNYMRENNLHPKTYVHFDMKGKPTGYSENMDSLQLQIPVIIMILLIPILFILYPLVFIHALNDGIKGYPFEKNKYFYWAMLFAWGIVILGICLG